MTYSHLSMDYDCAIPCHLSNCTKRILHKWTMCPIWRCTTHDDPITPALPLDHPLSIATIVLSLLGTMLMTLFITLAVIMVLRRWKRRQHQQLRTHSNSPIVGKKKKFRLEVRRLEYFKVIKIVTINLKTHFILYILVKITKF